MYKFNCDICGKECERQKKKRGTAQMCESLKCKKRRMTDLINADPVRKAHYREKARETVRKSARKARQDPVVRKKHNEWNRIDQAKRRANSPKLREEGLARLRLYKYTYKAKLRNLPHTMTEKDWRAVMAHFGGCAYCGSDKATDREHFIPLARGGGYTADNIVPACHRCNNVKGGKDPFVWLADRPAVLWDVTAYLYGVVHTPP